MNKKTLLLAGGLILLIVALAFVLRPKAPESPEAGAKQQAAEQQAAAAASKTPRPLPPSLRKPATKKPELPCNVAGCQQMVRAGIRQHWKGRNPSNGYHLSWEISAVCRIRSDKELQGHRFDTPLTILLDGKPIVRDWPYSSYLYRQYTPMQGEVRCVFGTSRCRVCGREFPGETLGDSHWNLLNELPEYP